MKRIFLLIITVLCAVVLWISCSKKDSNSSPASKTKLDSEQIKYLEKKYQGLKIDERALDGIGLEQFNSVSEMEDTIRKLQAYVSEVFSIPDGEMIVVDVPDTLNPPTNPGGGCDYGSKNTYPGKAGMLSSFHINFQYSASGISNVTFKISGIPLGWTFTDGGTHMYSSTSGCSQGQATFVSGILGWYANVHVNWSFDPATCKVTGKVGDGPCGNSVPFEEGVPEPSEEPTGTGGNGGNSGGSNTQVTNNYLTSDYWEFINAVKTWWSSSGNPSGTSWNSGDLLSAINAFLSATPSGYSYLPSHVWTNDYKSQVTIFVNTRYFNMLGASEIQPTPFPIN